MPLNSLRRRAVLLSVVFTAAWPLAAQNPATSVAVDAQANRHKISPHIYGVAFGATSDLVALRAPLNRSGGDSETRYNWQLNSDNRGFDWYFESFADTVATPGYRGDNFIATTRAAKTGAEAMLTIPMINYIGNLGAGRATLASFSIAKYGPQTGWDPYNTNAGNGISTASGHPYITGNDPTDANVANSPAFQQGWIEHLISTWGLSSGGGLKYYLMDNEPSIWFSTHRDVHPTGATYSEMYNDYLTYAATVRALDPSATIIGPEEWGWLGQFYSGYDQQNGTGPKSDYATHNDTYYYPWLLQQLAAYQKSTGTQLLDVLSVHYYPQDGSFSNDDSQAAQLIRNESTRSLWDPKYVDKSWIANVGIDHGIVNLIPNLKKLVKQYYPGLKIAVTEYNWGDEANLNGATTQADVEGIFGREALDMACRWTVPLNPSPTYLAMEMYRNYDGNKSAFGETSVSAQVADPDNLSAFAAERTSDHALTVMVINKQQGSTPVSVSLANFATSGTAQAWQINSASQTAVASLGSVPISANTITTTVPSQSITLFVIPPGNVTSVPPAPTGLAATVANGTVHLTWQAGGGATTYTVSRSVSSGGPFTAAGTVALPSPLRFKDTGLTDGTTYYYVVSGTNAAGTGPNSVPLAVTPIVPPKFSSTATASPNPVLQGSTTTITAQVTCKLHTLNDGIVQVLVRDPNSNTAATQNFSAQSFAQGQSQSYTLAFQPAIAGAYTVEVGVFSSTWQLWDWNSAATTIGVQSTVTFAATAKAKPATIATGATTNITATVKETGPDGLNNGIVELQVFNASGTAVATTYWTSQNFAAGQSLPYSYSWTPDSSIPAGTYQVMIGVFNSDWSYDYYWSGPAANIKVTP